MKSYKEVEGDLIKLALDAKFDVVAHGCNCFCTMGAGIAPYMAKTFAADKFDLEFPTKQGDIRKLGNIDYAFTYIKGKASMVDYKSPYVYTVPKINNRLEEDGWHRLAVVNAYTQYGFGRNHKEGTEIPLDYEALTLCLRKINFIFKGKHIGLPQIGCGLAGGSWERVKQIIQQELKDCDVTVVIYKPD